jgi:DNA repair protein RadC
MTRDELVRELMSSLYPASNAGNGSADCVVCDVRTPSESEDLIAEKLALAREILLRDLASALTSAPVFNSPLAVRDWLRLKCAALEHEVFFVLHMNVRHQLIEAQELFQGTLTHTSVYPREVVKAALARNSAAVILAHNHPSGIAEPSNADQALTKHLIAALALVDVKVTDHFIVAGASVLSFAEQGLL